MDSAAQADGEKRVRGLLVDPLINRGLVKPTTMTKAQFESMLCDMCAKLAYMDSEKLMALEEVAAGMAGGKEKDRFPIANRILKEAARIDPPSDDGSPLVRAVFAASVGLDALAAGWAPELLLHVKEFRLWPTSFVVTRLRESADDNIRQMRRADEILARGDALAPEVEGWRNRRLAIIRKCQAISDLRLGRGEG